jgi:phenol hydroxylase P5 protein
MPLMHRITIEPVGRVVDCREDQTILDACLRAGVWVPHSCTHGTCATCKAEVLDGEVDLGAASSFALMDFERDDGRALLCCATPRSDVVIEADVDVDEDLPVHPVRDYAGTVCRIEDIAAETRRIMVELDCDLAFNAGQYMSWQVPSVPGLTRTYSLANPPSQPRLLEFQVRRTPGGRCTEGWLFRGLSVGDTVALSGPYGRFVLRTSRPEPAVLIAGGTGIAPSTSMVRHALLDGVPTGRLTLYHGARSQAWLYDADLFRELERGFPERFSYRPCLADEIAAGFASGLVTDVLAADCPTLTGHIAYVCGPPGMVDGALRTLMGKRLFPRDIYREEFLDEGDKATGGMRSPLLRG